VNKENISVNQNFIDLADANLLESIREHARWQNPCECVEENGLLFVAGSTKFPGAYKNCVARIDGKIPAKEVLERARDFFARHERGFTVFVRASRDQDLDKLLKSAGLILRSDSPCMLIDAPLTEFDLPADIRVEHFKKERHILDAVQINSEAYKNLGLPASETQSLFGRPSQLLSPRVVGYVAYRGSQPLSTALTIFSFEGAGVYWVGTIAEARRKGLGAICTRLATNSGFSQGASIVTLQASPFGEPIYRKLGYKTYDRLKFYTHSIPHK
jgi:ribosomal protein S18 acetylase RimI-like enzyme